MNAFALELQFTIDFKTASAKEAKLNYSHKPFAKDVNTKGRFGDVGK